MLFVFIPRVSLRLPLAMCLLGLQPTLPKSETLVSVIKLSCSLCSPLAKTNLLTKEKTSCSSCYPLAKKNLLTK